MSSGPAIKAVVQFLLRIGAREETLGRKKYGRRVY